MMNAENAEKIISLYESDYDDFIKGLKKKANSKKKDAKKADDTAKEAQQHKRAHLADKARKLLDAAGGIEGATASIKNVMSFIRPKSGPADYSMNMGGDNGQDDKKKEKVPSVVWIAGGAVILLIGIYVITQSNKPKLQLQPAYLPQTS